MLKKSFIILGLFMIGVSLLGCNKKEAEDFTNPNFFAYGLLGVYEEHYMAWGFIDTTGEFVIDPEYDSITRTFDQSNTAQVVKNGQYLTIDPTGKELHNEKYGLYDGYTLSNEQHKLVDSDGETVYESDVNTITVSNSSQFVLVSDNSGAGSLDVDNVGIMNLDGEFIFPIAYGPNTYIINENFVSLQDDEGFKLAKTDGTIISDTGFLMITHIDNPVNHNFIFCYKKVDQFLQVEIYNIEQEKFMSETIADSENAFYVSSFFDRYGLVKVTDEDNSFGMINQDYQLIVPTDYTWISSVNDGMFYACTNLRGSFPNHYYLYNDLGEVLYDTDQYEIMAYNTSYITIRNSVGEYSIIDILGNTIIDFGAYNEAVWSLSDSGIYAKSNDTSKTNLWDLYNLDGSLLKESVSFERFDEGFRNGYMNIEKEIDDIGAMMYQFIDATGTIIPNSENFRFRHQEHEQRLNQFFKDGYAVLVTRDEEPHWTLINSQGEVLYQTIPDGINMDLWSFTEEIS